MSGALREEVSGFEVGRTGGDGIVCLHEECYSGILSLRDDSSHYIELVLW